MYKVTIVIASLLCVGIVGLKRIDSTEEIRFVENFNNTGLPSNETEHLSSSNGATNEKVGRLTREANESPIVFLVPVNEEHENADSETGERSRPSRKIKRCKTALCKVSNIPLSGEYGDKAVKASAGESNGEPYVSSTRWKRIRTAKNSVVSKLFKKETDSRENYEDDADLAESLSKSLANERNHGNLPFRNSVVRKEGKFVCHCRRDDCPDCRSSDSKKESVGSPRTKDNLRIMPYNLRRNYANVDRIRLLPIVHGVPSNVRPSIVPLRIAYHPADFYVGDPISQGHPNDDYQRYIPLGQYAIASKGKSDIPASRDNDFSASHPKGRDNEDDFDSNMRECIKLFGREACVLATSNKLKSQEESIGSARNYYEISSTEESSYKDYYDVTESDIDDRRTTTERSLVNYYEDRHDSTVSNAVPKVKESIGTTDNVEISSDDYYDSTEVGSTRILQNKNNNAYEDFDKSSTDVSTLGLDYSDIRVVTNGYFTSKGYDDQFDGNHPTDLDYRLSDDDSRDPVESSSSYDTKVQATNIPEILKDRSGLWQVSPTRSYSDLAKGRTFIDSTMRNDVDTAETSVKGDENLLEKERIIFEDGERDTETALKYGTPDPNEATSDSLFDRTTNDSDTWNDSIDGTILTTIEENSTELRSPEESTTRLYGENLNPIVGYPDEENISENFVTTSATSGDNEVEIGEKDGTAHLPFCDNALLINLIKSAMNNFTMDSSNPEESPASTKIPNDEELSPEILEIPNLRSFLSLPQVENAIVGNVEDRLSRFPENAWGGVRPVDAIRNTLRNILGILPKGRAADLPPMTVMERRFQNDRWTTHIATLLPPTEETEHENPLERIRDRVEDLVFNPVVGLQASKRYAGIQNIIVRAVKHEMKNANGMEVEEDTIRDIVGNVLGNAYRSKENESENNCDETTTEIVYATEKSDENGRGKVTFAVPLTNDAIDLESTTISESSTTEISEIDDYSNDSSNPSENNHFLGTELYIDNFPNDSSKATSTDDPTIVNEETTLGDQRESVGNTSRNKGDSNESEVLGLPQNSIVGEDNIGIEESPSASGFSLGKEKCRLCKIESCTSTHEIVTKIRKRVKTTRRKYYGTKENVASEGFPIVSSKGGEKVDVSTTRENLSDEHSNDLESEEDFVYEEQISKKQKMNSPVDNDDLSDLQNAELYYVGDNVKLPLEIKKLQDGSYALSISKSICENILKKKCPCCVPLEGNVRSIKRSPKLNDNVESVECQQRLRRSTISDEPSDEGDLIVHNRLEMLTMPVETFAKKYNLRLNLDDAEINKGVDIGSGKRSIERPNEIDKNQNEAEGRNSIYRDDDNRREKVERDANNSIFQRMKFINEMRKRPEPYRRQRAAKGIPTDKIEILKNLLNWFKTLVLD